MTAVSRKGLLFAAAAIIAVVGAAAGLVTAFYPHTRASAPAVASASAPKLTGLVNQLTSDDPRVEAEALAPGGTQEPGQPRTLLPAGSRLTVEPGTWVVTGVDPSGSPATGQVRARLTEPGRPASEVYLDVIDVGGRWLLYQTSRA
jgi:hypothetical protein